MLSSVVLFRSFLLEFFHAFVHRKISLHQIAQLDEAMFEAGSDSARLMELLREKEPLQAQVSAWFDEWAETEDLLAEFPEM